MDFTDKVVLITGGSRGIGRAAASQFARGGARVAINFRSNRAAAEQAVSELSGGPHLLVQADVADAEAVERIVNTVVERLGRLDILVNNAGIYEEHPIAQVDYATWRDQWARILATNLVGAANVAFCAAQQMMAQGGGRIINVSSRGAYRGEPESPAYGASKGGMNSMSQSLAKALGPHGISVYGVAPGWVDTEMSEETMRGPDGDAIRNQSPLGRIATADDVAYTICFLASEGAEFLTGGIIDVNGASYLR